VGRWGIRIIKRLGLGKKADGRGAFMSVVKKPRKPPENGGGGGRHKNPQKDPDKAVEVKKMGHLLSPEYE